MSKLPSFDDTDSNVDNKGDFPSMDELLEEFKNEPEVNLNDGLDEDLVEPNFESDFESFTEVSDELEDNNDWHEEEADDDETNTLIHQYERQREELSNEDDTGTYEDTDEVQENSDEHQKDLHEDEPDDPQDDYEDNFMGSLLPGMEPEVEIDEEPEHIKEPEPLSNEKDEEDTDEKAKEFFDNLKNKIIGLFKKGEGGPKKKPKGVKKPDKANQSPKAPIKLNKIQKIISLSIILLIIIIVVAMFVSAMFYSPLEDINTNSKFDDKDFDELVEVDIVDFEIKGKEITATIKNDSDMSATISPSLTLKEKSLIPFSGKKVECESDIVHIETDGEARQVFNCESEVDSTKKYKIKAEIDKF